MTTEKYNPKPKTMEEKTMKVLDFSRPMADMTNTQLQQLGAKCFEYFTGVHCTYKSVTLLEGSEKELWFCVGSIYFIIYEPDPDNKKFFISDESKNYVKGE